METQQIENPQGGVQKDTSQNIEQTTSPTKDTSDKLLAGKYKTQEDLEKGYKDLESTHGKKVSEYEQKAKEANERYEQLIAQISTRQQPQPSQEDTYETPEEKLSKEIEALKMKDRQRDVEGIINKFLDANPDLKGEAEQRIALSRFYEINAAKGQYLPLDKILGDTAEAARKDIASLREKVQKEVTEVRTEVKNTETPKGTSKQETVDESEDETFADYIKGRKSQFEQTRRLV